MYPWGYLVSLTRDGGREVLEYLLWKVVAISLGHFCPVWLSVPLYQSARDWDWVLTSDLAVCQGGDIGSLLFCSRMSLCSLRAVSGGLVGLQLWHSSSRLGFTAPVNCFLSCFCKQKGILVIP